MASTGEDARIQALFRELGTEDQSLTPSFGRSWHRAESESRQSSSVSWQPVLVIAMAIVVTGLAVALGFRQNLDQREFGFISPLVLMTNEFGKTPSIGPSLTIKKNRSVRRRRPTVLRSQPSDVARIKSSIQGAIALSIWRSPTVQLMQSPGSSLWTTTPLLNQSARELHLFLGQEELPQEKLKELSQ
jgi:hypothetical protein